MSYIGSWKIDDLLTFVCVTQVFSTGVATDADSVPTYRVYEDETGTPILTGSMALLDSANTAGFYSEQITLSAANGFEKGKCYSIYIAATVSSVAGATNRTFQIEAEVNVVHWNSLATVALPLVPTVAGRTLDCSAGGEAGVDWANVGSPTTAVNLSGTTVNLTNTVTTYTGNTPQTADVATLITTVGAAGAGLTGVALSLAGRQAIATTALVESYAALHAAPTWAQAIFEIRSLLAEKSVTGTTLTANKLDGSTQAETFTLNDAVSPTAITRAS